MFLVTLARTGLFYFPPLCVWVVILQDVVGQLWFLYLRSAGLAFTDDPSKEEELHKSFKQEAARRQKKFHAGRLRRKQSEKRRRTSSSSGMPSTDPPPAKRRSALTRSKSSASSAKKAKVVKFEDVPVVFEEKNTDLDTDDSGMMSDYLEQKQQEGLEPPLAMSSETDDSESDPGSDYDELNLGIFNRPLYATRRKLNMKLPRLLHLLALNFVALLSLGEAVVASDMCKYVQFILPAHGLVFWFGDCEKLRA